MIATHNQQDPIDNFSAAKTDPSSSEQEEEQDLTLCHIANLNTTSQLLLPKKIVSHHPAAGLNPLVDACGYLFSILGKLKQLAIYRQFTKLQKDLIEEINQFQEAINHLGYNAEYVLVCRYIICATFDDIITNTRWGGHGQWENYSLLTAFNQDSQADKFFSILERALKEPALYIDLMELIYICLSLGYKGEYRSTEYAQYQLEQITNNLYQHIRTFRGNFSKALSPAPIKPKTLYKISTKRNSSLLYVFFVTACIVMTIFIGLGYIMDVISNEAYKTVSKFENPITSKSSQH